MEHQKHPPWMSSRAVTLSAEHLDYDALDRGQSSRNHLVDKRPQSFRTSEMATDYQPTYIQPQIPYPWNHPALSQESSSRYLIPPWPSAPVNSMRSTPFSRPNMNPMTSVGEVRPSAYQELPMPPLSPQHQTPIIAEQAASQPYRPSSQIVSRKSMRSGPRKTATTLPDWDKHRAKIKQLYIDENLALGKVQELMREKYSFVQSDKFYKEKLDEWGYIKNLPKQTAVWVLENNKRRRDEGKDTVYEFGGKPLNLYDVEKKAKRNKLQHNKPCAIDFPTPKHITYSTPNGAELVLTPTPGINSSSSTLNLGSISMPEHSRWIPPPQSHETNSEIPRLSWEGYNRAELATLEEDAENLARLGQLEEAENKFQQALTGLVYLLSSTHEDTNEVAYKLADCYARSKRPNDADAVLDWLGREHIECWGTRNKKTATHVIRVMQQYKEWSRAEEAVNLLNRTLGAAKELPLYTTEQSPRTNRALSQTRSQGTQRLRCTNDEANEVARFVHHLEIAKQRIKPSHEEAEVILLRLISKSEENQNTIPVSRVFDAKCTLAQLYQNQSDLAKLYPALQNAGETFNAALFEKSKDSATTLITSMKLVDMLFNAELTKEANSMLEMIEKRSVDIMDGEDNFLDVAVALGKFYEDHDDWSKAELHFEHALAISMRLHRLECRVVKVLQTALENQRFDPSAVAAENLKRHFRLEGFERCGCGGFMGEFGARF